jgi:hypothetical protein
MSADGGASGAGVLTDGVGAAPGRGGWGLGAGCAAAGEEQMTETAVTTPKAPTNDHRRSAVYGTSRLDAKLGIAGVVLSRTPMPFRGMTSQARFYFAFHPNLGPKCQRLDAWIIGDPGRWE